MLIKLTISQTGELTLISPDEIATIEVNRKGPGSMVVLKSGKFRFVDESVESIYRQIFGTNPGQIGNKSEN